MGKAKIARFKENERLKNVFQPTREDLFAQYKNKGQWNSVFFKNDNPIVLELGCGHGDYTLALARKYPEKNFIGIDIKGARLCVGAKSAAQEQLHNVAFIRSHIELVDLIFAPYEISEIWITFPDPQILYRRAKHRLTHPNFLSLYKNIIAPQALIHLKTDDAFLHGYTLGVLQTSEHEILFSSHDIYNRPSQHIPADAIEIQTYYEKKFLKDLKKITYILFRLNP